MEIFLFILVGFGAGTFSGLLGLGGGVIMIPALVFLFGITQHKAQGTVLATMVPPIGLLAAIKYYCSGNVDVKAAILMCMGFSFGGLLGAQIAHLIAGPTLKRIFGIVLLVISIRLILLG
ncbi:sulfite exporter TauE/SafE family protein [bacterium]|nr:sulfite exporter TauE/SafE family protein [bacterium]